MQKTCKKHGGKRQLKLSWQDNWKTKFRLPQGKARVPSPRPCPNPHQDLQLPFPTGGGFRSSINPNQHSPGCHTPAGPIVRASGKFNTRTGHMSFRVSREPRTNQNTERRPAAGGPSTQLATAHPEIIHPMLRRTHISNGIVARLYSSHRRYLLSTRNSLNRKAENRK